MKTSLDHLPEAKQQEILAVANILRDVVDELREGKTGRKARFAIQKIILFGSYARTPKNGKPAWVYDPANGYISDYDILVIVNRMELYNNDGRELALPGNLSDEEKHEIAQKHFDQCYCSAEEFQVLYSMFMQCHLISQPLWVCCWMALRLSNLRVLFSSRQTQKKP